MPIKYMSDYSGRSASIPSPVISVVTCVRNGAHGIARTIESVRAQGITDLEYVIVDGGSTDGTLDILHAHRSNIDVLISEPDQGISDGLNKGIALTRGRFVALIHADDWFSPGQLCCAIEVLESSGADYVFGNLIFHLGNRPVHVVRGDATYTRRIDHIMPNLNHPTVIMRRESYERHGLFDTDYRLAMDYELLLRFHRAGLRGFYDPRLTGHMSLDGASDRHAIRSLAEVRAASIRYGYSPVKAWLRFLFRAFKTMVRRTLEKLLPVGITKMLRRLVNPAYRAAH